MFWISHRGNLHGPNKGRENTEEYILEAIHHGFDVEIDVWWIQGEWFLGHDRPERKTSISFLSHPKLWCHAKNLDALTRIMSDHRDSIHTFSHDKDPVILTSRGYLWVYPGYPINSECICVLPELSVYSRQELNSCKGICSDFISAIKDSLLPPPFPFSLISSTSNNSL